MGGTASCGTGRSGTSRACSATRLCLLILGAVLWIFLSSGSGSAAAGSSSMGARGQDPEEEDDNGGQGHRYRAQQDGYPDPSYPQPAPVSAASQWVTRELWDRAFPHRNDQQCPGAYFYEYDPFVTAVEAFPDFGTTGNADQQRQEIASFLAHIAHETGGGWITSPDGPHAWGLCSKVETPCQQYCGDYQGIECDQSHSYCGRGPFQLRWNYRYGMAGTELGFDGIHQPELVEWDPILSFKTALWFWYWKNPPRPALHDIHTGKWQPSSGDFEANRASGFGLTINIVNGTGECGRGSSPGAQDRIAFYQRMCSILEVDPGNNIDCERQWPYT